MSAISAGNDPHRINSEHKECAQGQEEQGTFRYRKWGPTHPWGRSTDADVLVRLGSSWDSMLVVPPATKSQPKDTP